MNRLSANIKGFLRRSFLLIDYLIWLIFDISKFKKIDLKSIHNVLIIHLGGFGEIVASTAVIKQLKEELNPKISYMLKKSRGEIVDDNPKVDEIIPYNDSFWDNVHMLKKKNFDLVIILAPGSFRIALMCFLSGIRYRVGCFKGLKDGLGVFFTRRRFPLQKKHAVVENVEMLQLIGLPFKKPQMEFFINKGSKEKVSSYLKSKKVKKFVIIHPGFGDIKDLRINGRLWPPSRYAQIVDHLVDEYGLQIVITGMDNEVILANEIVRLAKNKKKIFVTNGLFNFKEQAALLSMSELLIAPDTGMVHLSAALNKKVIDLMSRCDPYEWKPWMGEDNYRLLFHPLKFNYFERFYSDETGYECMLAISTDEVKKAIKELLT